MGLKLQVPAHASFSEWAIVYGWLANNWKCQEDSGNISNIIRKSSG